MHCILRPSYFISTIKWLDIVFLLTLQLSCDNKIQNYCLLWLVIIMLNCFISIWLQKICCIYLNWIWAKQNNCFGCKVTFFNWTKPILMARRFRMQFHCSNFCLVDTHTPIVVRDKPFEYILVLIMRWQHHDTFFYGAG